LNPSAPGSDIRITLLRVRALKCFSFFLPPQFCRPCILPLYDPFINYQLRELLIPSSYKPKDPPIYPFLLPRLGWQPLLVGPFSRPSDISSQGSLFPPKIIFFPPSSIISDLLFLFLLLFVALFFSFVLFPLKSLVGVIGSRVSYPPLEILSPDKTFWFVLHFPHSCVLLQDKPCQVSSFFCHFFLIGV